MCVQMAGHFPVGKDTKSAAARQALLGSQGGAVVQVGQLQGVVWAVPVTRMGCLPHQQAVRSRLLRFSCTSASVQYVEDIQDANSISMMPRQLGGLLCAPITAMGLSQQAWQLARCITDVLFVAAMVLCAWELQHDNWTPWEEVRASNPRVQTIPFTDWVVFLSMTRYVRHARGSANSFLHLITVTPPAWQRTLSSWCGKWGRYSCVNCHHRGSMHLTLLWLACLPTCVPPHALSTLPSPFWPLWWRDSCARGHRTTMPSQCG